MTTTKTHLLPFSFTLLLTGVAACTTETDDGSISREEAAAAGKADTNDDVCEAQGWYDDLICDTFCAMPDHACDGAFLLPRPHFGPNKFIVNVGTDVLVQLSDQDGPSGREWRVVQTDRTFGYPIEVLRADKLVQFRWKTDGLLDQSGIHDVEMAYGNASTPNDRYSFTIDVRPPVW